MDKRKRRFAWADDLIAKTGEVAREEAKRNNTSIVYAENGKVVREYADGRIEYIVEKIDSNES
ncbi:hypothetical protein [Halalkalibacter akibai]|uniref:Uncharacterized protein n=1 Tax=Halalkalibacter akibai (strain ATCC 43226 / DSM 21942 / CIP 109018 / JCM 9157 / 1139) TaxID=1236973 RepID=W4QYB7_HALA3|nr:hypothetical protein [Halalkalibacter akibai]GAE36653.1 hypothetical protein JCM9157_3856 [Halalkalibacter akibai JCM 9157]